MENRERGDKGWMQANQMGGGFTITGPGESGCGQGVMTEISTELAEGMDERIEVVLALGLSVVNKIMAPKDI